MKQNKESRLCPREEEKGAGEDVDRPRKRRIRSAKRNSLKVFPLGESSKKEGGKKRGEGEGVKENRKTVLVGVTVPKDSNQKGKRTWKALDIKLQKER